MKKEIRLESWNRQEHFTFFSAFDSPYFGLVAEVDCTKAYLKAREAGISFFIYYLFHSVKASNAVEAFRMRIEQGKVYIYDRIHASATLGRKDTTFAFSFIPYHDELSVFEQHAQKEIEEVKNSSGLRFNEDARRPDTIHYSSIPWVQFTGLSHAQNLKHDDSVPKISFGKLVEKNHKKLMPVSVHIHHALADGYHVGKFLKEFQQRLDA